MKSKIFWLLLLLIWGMIITGGCINSNQGSKNITTTPIPSITSTPKITITSLSPTTPVPTTITQENTSSIRTALDNEWRQMVRTSDRLKIESDKVNFENNEDINYYRYIIIPHFIDNFETIKMNTTSILINDKQLIDEKSAL